jgi:hypothetical protein
MEDEIKKLTAAIAQLTANATKNNENANPNTATGSNATQRLQIKNTRNMGAYCHSHGFHPVGDDHTSVTCGWKKGGTRTKPHGPTGSTETPTGQYSKPLHSPSSMTIPPGKTNWHQAIDRDWGLP